MPMTLLTASSLIVDVLGREPSAAWPKRRIALFAWESLLNVRDWRWGAGRRATIGLVAGQARYTLPTDFGYVMRISSPSESFYEPVELVSWRDLEEIRGYEYRPTVSRPRYYGAISWTDLGDSGWVPQLEIYPIPQATDAEDDPTLEVAYLPAAGAQPQDNAELTFPYPPFMEPLWTLWLRETALGLVEHDIAGVDQRVEVLMRGSTYMAAVKRDAGSVRIMRCPPGASEEGRPMGYFGGRHRVYGGNY